MGVFDWIVGGAVAFEADGVDDVEENSVDGVDEAETGAGRTGLSA